MMKIHIQLVICFIILNGVCSSSPFDWLKFKRIYKKHYESGVEEAKRKQIFLENANRIRDYERNNPNLTFTLSINHLADKRINELVSNRKLYVEPQSQNSEINFHLMDVPDSFDWRTKHVISTVKDQGLIGRVDAIVAVEVVESFHAIQIGDLESGSVARVVDCCPQPSNPFECIEKLGGICRASDYPKPTGQCIPNKCKPYASFNKILHLEKQDEQVMIQWIQNSTLFVGIDASTISFQAYQGGVYSDESCSKIEINHVLQLVGYGKTSTGDLYWICRNSWGVSWGEQGYIRVLRGKNTCGIASYVYQVA